MNTISNQCQFDATQELDVDRSAENGRLHEIVDRSADAGREHRQREHGVIIAKLAGIANECEPLVSLPVAETHIPARSTIAWSDKDIGREVVVMFEQGDGNKPIIMGFLQSDESQRSTAVQVNVDNDQLLLSADKEIVLRCGEASISLTRAGKILLRGKYLVSRSTGANKIKGASIQLN